MGKEVEINLTEKLLRISYQGKEIATHPRISGKGNFSTYKSHYPAYKCYCDTEYQEQYQVKMAQIGPCTEQLFFLILKEHPRDWNRTITGILSLTKSYPTDVLEASCKRALAYGITQYSIIRRICHNGSYLLPIEEAAHTGC